MTTKNASMPDRSPSSGALFDEWLVVEAQAGDRQAAERLYRRWNPRLARAARRYGAGEEAALDLAQECWLAIFKGLSRVRDPARFRSYAFAVLHRRGADYLRGVMKDREALASQPGAQLTRPDAPPGETLAIRQAFASLPPDQRLAAHLFFIEGLTLREIAEVQSIPEGTAKSRLFHARRKLKQALTPELQGEDL
jgi:RNA polymerase sigma-70 factor (ECF subfamily)